VGTHTGDIIYAWDFLIPVGDVVVAVRGGVVAKLCDQTARGRGWGVLVIHDDGTMATYGHLMREGLLVKKGERILKGEPIGKVGPESGCPTPHLHFHVTESCRSTRSIPIRFKGPIANPVAGDSCTSNNAEPADLAQLRLLRRALPLLIMAIRIKADGLEQEIRTALAPAIKNPKLSEWAKPYESIGVPAPLDLPKELRSTLTDALRADFKGSWDKARPLYEKVMKLSEDVHALRDAITAVP
jgi:murein DD-endopeptidase MepM/ murein hydrolase activator NlpD